MRQRLRGPILLVEFYYMHTNAYAVVQAKTSTKISKILKKIVFPEAEGIWDGSKGGINGLRKSGGYSYNTEASALGPYHHQATYHETHCVTVRLTDTVAWHWKSNP